MSSCVGWAVIPLLENSLNKLRAVAIKMDVTGASSQVDHAVKGDGFFLF